jgi:predicted SnoaL-like aldol condensation-catalyzing enzyme
MEEIVTCFNDGEFARAASLFTDEYWRAEIRSPEIGQSFANAASTPATIVREGEREELIEIRDVRTLEDGRVSAIVILKNARDTEPDADLVIFEREGGRWLVDEVITTINTEGTPTT